VSRPASTTSGPLRRAGAVALLGVGLVHLEELVGDHYAAIPMIGTLFTLNAAAAAVVAVALWTPLGRVAHAVLALAGIAVAAGSLAALVVSERTTLFGFHEVGWRPVIVLAVALESATVVLLSAAVAPAGPRRGGRAEAAPPRTDPAPSGR
jgi:hypothetical protein